MYETSSLPNFTLQCCDCLNLFGSQEEADYHKENGCLSKSSTKFPCSDCNQVFDSPEQYCEHGPSCLQNKEKKLTENCCERCKKVLSSKYACIRHMKSSRCSQGSHKTYFQCHNCMLQFSKKTSLVKHFELKVCSNPKNKKCFVDGCNTFFRKCDQLAEHVKNVHGNNVLFEGSDMNWEIENLEFDSEEDFHNWLAEVSDGYNCNYFASAIKSKKGVTYCQYKCQYDKRTYPNKATTYYKRSNPNLLCPSRICSKIVNGTVIVNYYKTHNHKVLKLKRHKMGYSRSKRPKNETLQHYIENANFSDEGKVETNVSIKHNVQSNHFVGSHQKDGSSLQIHHNTSTGYSNQQHALLNYGVKHNYIDQINKISVKSKNTTSISGNEVEQMQQNYSHDESENKIYVLDNKPEEIQQKHSNSALQPKDVRLAKEKTILKYEISWIFSSIQDYVKSTENIGLLNSIKNNLENVLEKCVMEEESQSI